MSDSTCRKVSLNAHLSHTSALAKYADTCVLVVGEAPSHWEVVGGYSGGSETALLRCFGVHYQNILSMKFFRY